MLQIRLLGHPKVSLNDNDIPPGAGVSKKALALLFYLVSTGHRHSRDELASLFWCDMPDAQARKNLRNILPVLRRCFNSHLSITHHMIGFERTAPYSLDVEQFCTVLKPDLQQQSLQTLSEATALYTGDFLTGFHIGDSPVFEEWMTGQRERLHGLAVAGLTEIAERSLRETAYHPGLNAVQRLLQLEPWSERAHQLQMELLAASGERDRALMQYEQCRQVLAQEFGVEPTSQTHELYQQIKAGAYHTLAHTASKKSDCRRATVQLRSDAPAPTTPIATEPLHIPSPGTLYGRETELAQLLHWITVDRCRLVLLNGQVGSGKTTLARKLVERLTQPELSPEQRSGRPGRYGFERIFWRSLRDQPPLDRLLPDQPTHAGSTHSAAGNEALELLFARLRSQRCLLILDDSETLADQSAGSWAEGYRRLIMSIVAGEHQSCVLVVGREQLPLGLYFEATSPGARSLHLTGLDHAAAHSLLNNYGLQQNTAWRDWLIAQYDAMPLFLHLGARAVQDMFQGDLDTFAALESPIFDTICAVLDTEYRVLDDLERAVLHHLAGMAQPRTFVQLLQTIAAAEPNVAMLHALQHLQRRSLLMATSDGFVLPQVIRSYLRQTAASTWSERNTAYAGNNHSNRRRHGAWWCADRVEAPPDTHSRLAYGD
jgi:DNA-binding SARP family transcriptional activator